MKIALAIIVPIILLWLGAHLYFRGTMYPLEFVGSLLFGWVRFLMRVVPEMEFSIAGTVAAVVCLILIAIVLHRLCGWLFRYNHKDDSASAVPPRWRRRWTLAVLGVVMLMFVAGLSAVGVTHQTGWLATSPEPLIGPSETQVNRMEATNDLKFIGLATLNYPCSDSKLPPGATFDEHGNGLHSWTTLIMPYGLYDIRAIDLKVPWNHPKNAPHFKRAIYNFLYPGVATIKDVDGYGVSHYASNVHVIGGSKQLKLADITDGAENTLLIGQVGDNYMPVGQPGNWRDPALGINTSPHGFGNPPRTGSLFVFADGHVQFLTSNTSPQVLKALSTPAAGD